MTVYIIFDAISAEHSGHESNLTIWDFFPPNKIVTVERDAAEKDEIRKKE